MHRRTAEHSRAGVWLFLWPVLLWLFWSSFFIAMIVISWHVSIYVEEVESNTCWARGQKAAGRIVKSNWFEFIAGILILLHLGVNCPTSDYGISVSNCPCCCRNLISIGIEAELSVTNDLTFYGGFWPGGACDFAGYLKETRFPSLHPYKMAGVERIFLALYCIEALIRLMAGGWSTFKDLWFVLLGGKRLKLEDLNNPHRHSFWS